MEVWKLAFATPFLMFKLRKKNKYNIANGTIALGTGIVAFYYHAHSI